MKKKFANETKFTLPEFDVNAESDVLLFDKPYRCTSYDVVGKVRGIMWRKVGHRPAHCLCGQDDQTDRHIAGAD